MVTGQVSNLFDNIVFFWTILAILAKLYHSGHVIPLHLDIEKVVNGFPPT